MNIAHIVAAAAYGGMVMAAAGVAILEHSGRNRRLHSARNVFIAYVVGATLAAGVSQIDLWPLSSWSLMTRAPTRQVGANSSNLGLVALDGTAQEHPIDYRAVEPFAIEELMAWMRVYFLALPAASRDSAARYLLLRLNAARVRVRAGNAPGLQERWLGPLRAPFHQLHPKQWRTPESVPPGPFIGLRLYSEQWDLEERALDPTRVTRTRLYEYRQAPLP